MKKPAFVEKSIFQFVGPYWPLLAPIGTYAGVGIGMGVGIQKKEAILSKNDDFGEVVEVPGISTKKTVKILKINWLYS